MWTGTPRLWPTSPHVPRVATVRPLMVYNRLMGAGRNEKHPAVSLEGAHASTHGDRRFGSTVEVPVGLEALLYQAARDEAFKRCLLADRDAAIEACHVELRPSERATLAAIPDDVLAAMVDRLVVQNPRGRSVMNKVAAAVATLAASTAAASGCETNEQPSRPKALTVETDPGPTAMPAGIDPATLIDGGLSDFDEPPIVDDPASSNPSVSPSSTPTAGSSPEKKNR